MTVPAGPETASLPADDRAAVIAARIEQAATGNQQAKAGLARTGDDDDRSWIARMIITVFVAVIVIVLIFLAVQGYTTQNWTLAANTASDLFKSAVLPIVTLVLGFYFGKSGKG